LDSCRYNLENLLSAGVTNQVLVKDKMNYLCMKRYFRSAGLGYEKYLENHSIIFRANEYLKYAKTNIGSRPKRSKSEHLDFADLRAIPLWVLGVS
jgi:phosphoenolpyruvate carboxylase